jgi:arylsulfatase
MEIYAAMVSDLDQYVGELIGYLEQIGELDNTFIVFSSDNGAEPGRRDLTRPIADHIGKEYDHSLDNLGSATSYVMYGPNWASAGATPFNRHKFTAFDGGTHVPAFVYYPQRVQAGSRSDAVGTVMDLLPTFLALAGAQHPGTTYRDQTVLPVQGRSLLPVLYGEATAAHPADALFGWELFGQRAVRQGDLKLVWDHSAPEAQRRWQLFNLAADPFEQNDLTASNPDQYQQLLTLWDRYDEENGVIY